MVKVCYLNDELFVLIVVVIQRTDPPLTLSFCIFLFLNCLYIHLSRLYVHIGRRWRRIPSLLWCSQQRIFTFFEEEDKRRRRRRKKTIIRRRKRRNQRRGRKKKEEEEEKKKKQQQRRRWGGPARGVGLACLPGWLLVVWWAEWWCCVVMWWCGGVVMCHVSCFMWHGALIMWTCGHAPPLPQLLKHVSSSSFFSTKFKIEQTKFFRFFFFLPTSL